MCAGSNVKQVKRPMKHMEVFRMNACSTADMAVYQKLISRFPAGHSFTHH